MRIVTWNVLAPELLQFFWRSSYGLPLLADEAQYLTFTAARFENIVTTISQLAPDILLLQEISDTDCVDDGRLPEYIANKTHLALASESFKRSRFTYGLPPTEQPLRSSSSLSMDSGVCTLYNPSTVHHMACIGRAEDGGHSPLFNTGVGSPFTMDLFSSRTAQHASPLTVINTHIRMQFPHIIGPLTELGERVTALAGLPEQGQGRDWMDMTVLGGDLNAGHPVAADDLALALALNRYNGQQALRTVWPKLVDVPFADQGQGTARDDHVLVGKGIRVVKAEVCPLPLLAMGANPSLPTSDAKLWGVPSTPYALHAGNAALLSSLTATSDHPPLVIDIE